MIYLVGFIIAIDQVLANFNLVQNRQSIDFINIMHELNKTDHHHKDSYIAHRIKEIEEILLKRD